jgi:endonuclease/exonuclease/phosphatase (EEP) superfamily protein YafD
VGQIKLRPLKTGKSIENKSQVTYVANHMSMIRKIASSALDHIYFSSSKSIKTKVLEESASDHYPLVAVVDPENKA